MSPVRVRMPDPEVLERVACSREDHDLRCTSRTASCSGRAVHSSVFVCFGFITWHVLEVVFVEHRSLVRRDPCTGTAASPHQLLLVGAALEHLKRKPDAVPAPCSVLGEPVRPVHPCADVAGRDPIELRFAPRAPIGEGVGPALGKERGLPKR